MKISLGQSVVRCIRAAPVLVVMFLAFLQPSCDERPIGDPEVIIHGVVQSSASLSPIESARVDLSTELGDYSDYTDSVGIFSFSVFGVSEIRNVTLKVEKSGFASFDTVLAEVKYGVYDLQVRLTTASRGDSDVLSKGIWQSDDGHKSDSQSLRVQRSQQVKTPYATISADDNSLRGFDISGTNVE